MDGFQMLQAFMKEIRRIESAGRGGYTAQNSTTKAYGAYQFLPGIWKDWAPRALGTDPSLARASKELPPTQWVPEPTPENQDATAEWRMGRYINQLGDWRRVAASWRSGQSVGEKQPDGWSSGTIKYVNSACIPLGFPITDNETVLPPLPTGEEGMKS